MRQLRFIPEALMLLLNYMGFGLLRIIARRMICLLVMEFCLIMRVSGEVLILLRGRLVLGCLRLN